MQPKSYKGIEERKNLNKAVEFIKKASKKEAQIISFSECYPGSYSGPMDFSPVKVLAKLAEDVGSYVLFGSLVSENGKIYDRYFLASPTGEIVGKYDKVIISPGDKFLSGGKEYSSGEGFKVFKTDLCNIGILICFEVWFPEPSRIVAQKGADVIFFPIGNVLYDFRPAWKTLLWARAIENLVYIPCSQNIYGDEGGFSFIISPEKILAENSNEGILVADIDLGRLHKLRSETVRIGLPKGTYIVPGLLKYVNPRKLYNKWL